MFDGAGQNDKDNGGDNDMSNKKKPTITRPPAPTPPVPPRSVTAERDYWADLVVPPVPRVWPVGSSARARVRDSRLWWRPRRLP